MSSAKLPIPTPSNTSGAPTEIGDIHYLLYLEALRRYKDNEASIFRHLEDKYNQYQETRTEYTDIFKKYVTLNKLIATDLLLAENPGLVMELEKTDQAEENAVKIMEKLNSGLISEFIDEESWQECKSNLGQCKQYDKLLVIQSEIARNKAAVSTIESVMDNVETTLETVATQGLDHFNDELESLNTLLNTIY